MADRFRRFELHERIGLGGMAEVYRSTATDPDGASRTVVVKKILPHLSADPAYQQMFLEEARTIALLDHPNIVRLLDLGHIDDLLFLALEYVEGADLAVVARAFRGEGKRIPIASALQIVSAVAVALDYAHTRTDESGASLRVVHRDVSPGNILLSRTGEVKLTDFGIARTAARQLQPTRAGTVKGNVHYAAPEQISGRELDHRADIYSLGMVLYTILAGKNPYEGEEISQTIFRVLGGSFPPLREFNPDVPPALEAIVSQAMRLIPALRYPTAGAMRDALLGFAASAGITLDASLLVVDLDDVVSPASRPTNVPSIVVRLAPMIAEVVASGDSSIFRTSTEPGEETTGVTRIGEGDPPVHTTRVSIPLVTPEPVPELQPEADEETLPPTEAMQRQPPRTKKPAAPISSEETRLDGHRQSVSSIAVRGDRVLSGSHDESLRLWSHSERAMKRQLRGHRGPIEAVAISRDGTLGVSGARDKTLRLWDLESGEMLRTLTGHGDRIFSVDFSEDGQAILSGSSDRTVMLWSIQRSEPLRTIGGHRDAVTAVAFFPGADRAVSGSYDSTLRVWNLATGASLHEIDTLEDSVRAVAVSPDGRLLLSAGASGTLRLWDLEHPTPLHDYPGHKGPVVAVRFSRDGRRAVSACYDGTLRLWDVFSGEALRVFEGHDDAVLGADFSDDGSWIASAGADKSVRIWAVDQRPPSS